MDEYRGVKHFSNVIPEEYKYVYIPEEVENRWEPIGRSKFGISRTRDIIYQIRTPIDTIFTLESNGNPILKVDLKKDEPFKLKLPLRSCNYSYIDFIFTPDTTAEWTYIHTWNSFMEPYLSNWNMAIPENNLLIFNGMLSKFKEQSPE